MTPADIPAGMRLKEIAGWNQTLEDWQRFLEADPEGCFVAEWNGQVAGTVATIVYEHRFAWIGMVLVDPQVRGKGIGTALLLRAIDHLDARKVPCMKLDATPQGKPIYTRLGFQIEYEIERHSLTREITADSGTQTTAAPAENFEPLLEFDHQVFGADRSALLRSLARSAPSWSPSTVPAAPWRDLRWAARARWQTNSAPGRRLTPPRRAPFSTIFSSAPAGRLSLSTC